MDWFNKMVYINCINFFSFSFRILYLNERRYASVHNPFTYVNDTKFWRQHYKRNFVLIRLN